MMRCVDTFSDGDDVSHVSNHLIPFITALCDHKREARSAKQTHTEELRDLTQFYLLDLLKHISAQLEVKSSFIV